MHRCGFERADHGGHGDGKERHFWGVGGRCGCDEEPSRGKLTLRRRTVRITIMRQFGRSMPAASNATKFGASAMPKRRTFPKKRRVWELGMCGHGPRSTLIPG